LSPWNCSEEWNDKQLWSWTKLILRNYIVWSFSFIIFVKYPYVSNDTCSQNITFLWYMDASYSINWTNFCDTNSISGEWLLCWEGMLNHVWLLQWNEHLWS
jgi:hypothetical protein